MLCNSALRCVGPNEERDVGEVNVLVCSEAKIRSVVVLL